MSRRTKIQDDIKETLVTPSVSFIKTIPTIEHVRPQTENQRKFVKFMKQNNSVVICLGVPGSGKTLLALYTAIQLYNSPDSEIDTIYYVRSNVGTKDESELGALPGTLKAIDGKLAHLVYPITSNLTVFMRPADAKALLEFEKIQVMTVSNARGITFRNSFVIVDEIQNLSKAGLKTILTRIGQNSKMVLIGDPDQTDLDSNLKLNISPIQEAASKLKSIPGVGTVNMTKEDIIRHPIIQNILDVL